MQKKSKCLFFVECIELFMQENGLHKACTRKIVCGLLCLCIPLLFSMPFTSETWASEKQNIESYENLDARWLPWIGSWRLVSNTTNSVGIVLKEEYLLTVRPDDKGEFITMESSRDKTVMFEEKIKADGLRRPLDKDECTGWHTYSWSETGKRLLFNGESSCAGDSSQTISGISMIDTVGDWVDIKLHKSGKEKIITIRMYRNVEDDSVTPAPVIPSQARFARISVGTKFSIDELIELSGKVEPEVLEAALIEMRSGFPVNSKLLMRLSNAKVPSKIVDLVVALSFPEKFTVEGTAISWVKDPSRFRAPYYHWPMCPWYWTSSVYYPYGYRYWGWDWYQRYGWYPYSYGYVPHSGGSGTDSNARLIAGHGYSRVYSGSQRRYAQPRNIQATRGTTSQSSSSSSAASSTATASGGSSGVSSGGAYASPGGYSSGGSSAGSAQPR